VTTVLTLTAKPTPFSPTSPAFAVPSVKGNVDAVIPSILDKIDRAPASVEFMTMPTPALGITRRDMQINRRWQYHAVWCRLHNERLGVNQLWHRCIAKLQHSIKTGLPHAHSHPYVRGNLL